MGPFGALVAGKSDQCAKPNSEWLTSLAHWGKALDHKVTNSIFQVQFMLRPPNQAIITHQMVERIAESFSDATSCC